MKEEPLTGPYRLATYMSKLGEQAYFVNIPSKFIGADGRSFWFCYAHGWQRKTANPPGSRYAMCLFEVSLLRPGARGPGAPAGEKR
jgi:hypothetical protein